MANEQREIGAQVNCGIAQVVIENYTRGEFTNGKWKSEECRDRVEIVECSFAAADFRRQRERDRERRRELKWTNVQAKNDEEEAAAVVDGDVR